MYSLYSYVPISSIYASSALPLYFLCAPMTSLMYWSKAGPHSLEARVCRSTCQSPPAALGAGAGLPRAQLKLKVVQIPGKSKTKIKGVRAAAQSSLRSQGARACPFRATACRQARAGAGNLPASPSTLQPAICEPGALHASPVGTLPSCHPWVMPADQRRIQVLVRLAPLEQSIGPALHQRWGFPTCFEDHCLK